MRINETNKKKKKKAKKQTGKIVIACSIIAVIICAVGVSIYAFGGKEVPDVNEQNTKFSISETEVTSENIKINILSKRSRYNLYYYIDYAKDKGEVEDTNTTKTSRTIEKKVKETEIDNKDYELYKKKEDIEIEGNAVIYFKYELNGTYSTNPYKIEITNIEKRRRE